ncbi:hypothetical protein DDZ14_13540 [Maritimibacter sp. 55A14]|nr:hypothetical protein DDZ14_13540 [Maritimibacter sp. 55A14]
MIFLATGPVFGAASNDPDWPCIQRKVPTLSPGVMWPHPMPENGLTEETRAAVEETSDILALRRVTLEEAEAAVARAEVAHPEFGRAEYGAIFARVFDRLNARRNELMDGIARYARNQARMAENIEALRAQMKRLESAESPDFDRIDKVEAELDWHERIFTDRARSLRYVCETPVLLEQRIYAIAQMLLARVDE